MNPLQSSLSRGLTRLNTLTGKQTFTWQGQTIFCTPSNLRRGVTIEVGGNPVEISLTLNVDLSEFTDANGVLGAIPVTGQTITFKDATQRILEVARSGPDSHLEIHLADPDSGKG